MKMVAVETCAPAPVVAAVPAVARLRAADYLELTKPRIAVMVLFTVGAGVLLGAGTEPRAAILLHAVLGTALVAGGASALNQWLERRNDARMRRTENRPLPAGRLLPVEALVFGSLLGIVGVAYLAVALPHPSAAIVAALTFFLYVAVYTPLKTRTPLNTLVGAVPGALPTLIGGCARDGAITGPAVSLFLILFCWQLPHFLAIAWMYRTEYARGGFRMLPAVDRDGRLTAWTMIATCLLLIAASFGPVWLGVAGPVYLTAAVLFGLVFLASAERFRRSRTERQARRVLRASLIYLTGLLPVLMLDGILFRSFAW